MKVRIYGRDSLKDAQNLLIRGTNWIGDVVMSLPAVSAVRKFSPKAKITVLAKPWVADIYRASSDVDEVLLYERPGRHGGIGGFIKLLREVRMHGFDASILLQNAIEAALICRFAGVPIRAGYNSDGRGFLLTHSVIRTSQIRKRHQVEYYLEMVKSLGCDNCEGNVSLRIEKALSDSADRILKSFNVRPGEVLVGIAPGAAYGPAKMWYPERYAEVAARLSEHLSARVLIFGSSGDYETAKQVAHPLGDAAVNLAGKTSLGEAMALISRCRIFLSNDSGLMHLAGALDVPLVAVFGSTNPVTTSPLGNHSVVIYKDVSCSPCLKKQCPTDFRCMDRITADEVYSESIRLLDKV